MGWTYFILLFLFAPKLEIRSSGWVKSILHLCQCSKSSSLWKKGLCLYLKKRGGSVLRKKTLVLSKKKLVSLGKSSLAGKW